MAAVIYCLVVLIKRGSTIEPHRFHWFAIAMLIIWIANSILFIVFYKTPYRASIQQTFRYMDFLFMGVEFTVFSYFYYYRLYAKRLKSFIVISNIVFLLAMTAIISLSAMSDIERIVRLRGWLFAIESIFFLILGVAYFITLFSESILRSLLDIPGCWIAAGITMFMLVSIPLAVGEILFYKVYHLWSGFYAIYYLLYTVFFIMLARACYCKTKEYPVPKRKTKTTEFISSMSQPIIR